MNMNNATHTPGPLKAVQIIIENSPCTWAVQRKSLREQWGKPSIATYIDNEADARLFAAAPAMYEALKLALAWSMDGTPDSELSPIELGMRQAVEAALVQVEGKHP